MVRRVVSYYGIRRRFRIFYEMVLNYFSLAMHGI